MSRESIKLTVSTKSKVVIPTGFKGYDVCINPYVGCQFGCQYCYVRFFVKDEEKPWGEFVRRREHIVTRLPKELSSLAGQRLVMGTMTDPYQPEERKHRITRAVLQILAKAPLPLAKVGIFTRSPIVLDDIDLIATLPRKRVHYSITPFNREVMTKIEQIPIQTRARWAAVKKLKEAGIRVHVNVAPAIPIISDAFTEEYCQQLASLGVDEFFVDPMQAYSDSFQSLQTAMQDQSDWNQIQAIMTDKVRYANWKKDYRKSWETVWKKHGRKDTLAIWSDHENKVWIDMQTGKSMDPKSYGDDITP